MTRADQDLTLQEDPPLREDPRGHPEEDIHPDEIHQWAEKFGVSAEELRVAIERVGPVSSEVRKFLSSERSAGSQ